MRWAGKFQESAARFPPAWGDYESLDFLGINLTIGAKDIIVHDENAGSGYGHATEKKAEAIRMAAELEGLFLGPVYTASSMACLIDLARRGFFKKDEVAVFLHTGGSPALFPYKGPLRAFIQGDPSPWTVPPWAPGR